MQRNDDHLNFFDTMRGVALIGVFLAHCRGEAYGWNFEPSHAQTLDAKLTFPLVLGATAVPIFFAISGFCIHLAHRRSSRKDWATFFTRRFFRIYPPYFVALVLECILFLTHILPTGDDIDRGQFLKHLFLIHNGWERTFLGLNGSFWSIAVEVQVYLLYPLLFVMGRSLGWTRTLVITAAIELSIRAWAGVCATLHTAPPPIFILQSPFAYWFSWAIGAAVAEAFLNGQPLPFARIPIWFFPVTVVLTSFVDFLQPFFFPLASLATVVVITRLASAENVPSARVSWVTRYLRYAGTISYSMYLLHQPFVHAVADRLHHTRIGGHPFLVLLFTSVFWFPILFLASCFYNLLEQPSIALGKWVIGRFRGATPIVAT
jgi:peptidoglycan/LPS O-acetylase OafA/YrhL